MRASSLASFVAPFASFAPALVGLGTGLLLLSGCAQRLGNPCDLGVDVDGGRTSVISSAGALECASRICLLPSQQRPTPIDTGPLCSATCESDDDCADAETRDRSNPSDRRCVGRFLCRRVIPGVTNSELACKRLCVCQDFLPTTGAADPSDQGCDGDRRAP